MRYFPTSHVSGKETLSKRSLPVWVGEPLLYGEEPFLVRIQAVQFTTGENQLVVSDRRETFTGMFLREANPTKYLRISLALDEFHSRRKVYLWARYLGERRLSIRIDPKPDQSRLIW